MPGAVDERAIAAHIDRVRRRVVACRSGVVVRDVPGGWMRASATPGAGGEFPSNNMNAVCWLSPREAITAAEVHAAIDAMREAGQSRFFYWLAPWVCDAAAESALRGVGAQPWPYVEYIALARAAGAIEASPPPAFPARALSAAEAPEVLRRAAPWYGVEGEAAGLRLLERGISEFHTAFERDEPVAIGMLSMDGAWGYLGAAATAPEKRGRGGQTAVIISRARRAAELGAAWCVSETNTAVPISLRNLKRCGFAETIRWRVFVWQEERG